MIAILVVLLSGAKLRLYFSRFLDQSTSLCNNFYGDIVVYKAVF